MKKTLLLCIPLSIFLAFTGCSNSEQDKKQEATTQLESTTVSEATTSTKPAQADASETIKDNILSITPSAILSVTDNDGLSVDLTDQYDSSEKGYIGKFMYDCARIVATSNFSEKYSGICVSYVSKNVFPVVTITDYKNVSDYSSNLFCPGEDANSVAAAKIMYNKLFGNRDINSNSAEPEDDLWFYSSFPNSLLHELSDSTYVINYRYNTDDTYAYGKSVASDINTAAENLRQYLHGHSDALTFDNILIICFDGNSETRYCEYKLSEKEDGNWGVTLYNFGNDNFKKGFEEIIN